MAARTWSFPAVPERVAAARRAVFEYAEAHAVPEPPLADVTLAVTEAVSNAVVHAFRSSVEPGTVTVEMEVMPARSVTVSVCDDGDGFSPRDDSPGLGVGLALIGRVATSLAVRPRRAGRGTEVRMRFDFSSAA